MPLPLNVPLVPLVTVRFAAVSNGLAFIVSGKVIVKVIGEVLVAAAGADTVGTGAVVSTVKFFAYSRPPAPVVGETAALPAASVMLPTRALLAKSSGAAFCPAATV